MKKHNLNLYWLISLCFIMEFDSTTKILARAQSGNLSPNFRIQFHNPRNSHFTIYDRKL